MEKKDLKSGMTVKLRNGDVCLVIDGFIADVDKFIHFKSYKDDLSNVSKFAGYDIMEVYQYDNDIYNDGSQRLSQLLNITAEGMKLLWKRQELPKLTSSERVILENIDKSYKWIARDKNDKLWVYNEKPLKQCERWNLDRYHNIIPSQLPFSNLFNFVKWADEQPYNIEELLKGEK